jgi:UDP-N-acetylmuramate--alanine ligase
VVTYGAAEGCDVRYSGIVQENRGSSFTATFSDGRSVRCSIAIPGIHMVSNACSALATAWTLGLDSAAAAEALSSFSGVRRRFDVVAEVDGVTVVDDYAHHPTEVSATLAAAAGLGFRRVWALFQPHRYSRTEAFGAEFGDSFSAANRVVLMDVYSAGEAPIPGVSGKTILDALLARDRRARAAYLPHRSDVVPYIADRVRPGDLVLTMGAGDVTAIGPELVAALRSGGTQTCP